MYIEREALIEVIEDDCPEQVFYSKRDAIDCIKAEPSADVAPVVRGEWAKDGDFLICLNCESEINIRNSLGVENRKNYCPNCGAKMQGGKDNV